MTVVDLLDHTTKVHTWPIERNRFLLSSEPAREADRQAAARTAATGYALLRQGHGQFETSVKVTRYWKLVGVRPVLSLIVGDLTVGEPLQPALWKDGRVLFGPYRGQSPSLGQPLALISWGDVGSLSARTNVYRGLHGYGARSRRYAGLLEKFQGQRVSKGSILVPVSALQTFKALFRRQRVPIRIRVLYELGRPERGRGGRTQRTPPRRRRPPRALQRDTAVGPPRARSPVGPRRP
jgi:hypothetical protein